MKLANGVAATAPTFTFYLAAAAGNTLAGGANTRVVSSSVTVVGFVGNGGTLTINNVDGGTAGGTKTLSLDYINADFVFSNTACSNCRNAFISVNGGTAVQAQLPISGQVSHQKQSHAIGGGVCARTTPSSAPHPFLFLRGSSVAYCFSISFFPPFEPIPLSIT